MGRIAPSKPLAILSTGHRHSELVTRPCGDLPSLLSRRFGDPPGCCDGVETSRITLKSQETQGDLTRSALYRQTGAHGDVKKKAVAGTLCSHDTPDADLEQPAKPAKLAFFDSTDLHQCPDVGRGYVSQGSQLKVDSPGLANPWYALFGSLIYPSGEGLYTIHERKRHQEVRTHLQLLPDSEPDTFWIVVSDNASAHTTPKLDEFLSRHHNRLCLVFQPTYSPHLNLIERLWRLMRHHMTRN